jgi:hypothetical protein
MQVLIGGAAGITGPHLAVIADGLRAQVSWRSNRVTGDRATARLERPSEVGS